MCAASRRSPLRLAWQILAVLAALRGESKRVDVSNDDPCAEVKCGEHSTCVTKPRVFCACDDGFAAISGRKWVDISELPGVNGFTHYDWIGVAEGASGEVIRSAYLKAVKLHHPDKHPDDPGAPERFKAFQKAYEVLRDPYMRREYDEESRSAPRCLPMEPLVGAPRKAVRQPSSTNDPRDPRPPEELQKKMPPIGSRCCYFRNHNTVTLMWVPPELQQKRLGLSRICPAISASRGTAKFRHANDLWCFRSGGHVWDGENLPWAMELHELEHPDLDSLELVRMH